MHPAGVPRPHMDQPAVCQESHLDNASTNSEYSIPEL